MFDLNKFAKYIVELKMAAIKALERDEFLEYFLVKMDNQMNDYVFNKRTYKKLRKYLSSGACKFWDEAYDIAKNGKKLRNSNLFYNNRNNNYTQENICLYLEEDNYKYLKKNIYKLEKSNFYEGNIVNLKLKKNYDYIMLSNICNYADDIDEFRKFTDLVLMKHLNKNGILIGEYYYGSSAGPKDYYGTKYEFDAFNSGKKDYVITKKRN
jgi:hypothetical protein